MRTILAILAILSLSVQGVPVRSDVGGRDIQDIEDYGPKNYWTWPTESANVSQTKTPTSVWIPEVGKWYGVAAYNGYIRKDDISSGSGRYGSWTYDSVTTTFFDGYSYGIFLDLEPGDYTLEFDVDGYSRFSLGFFEEADGGYIYSGTATALKQGGPGHQVCGFVVPEYAALQLLIVSSRDKDADPLTTTNIKIWRED